MSDPQPGPRPLPVAAFFDIDKTLVNGASALFLAKAARSLGIVGRKDLLRFGFEAMRFQRRGERMSVLDSVRTRAMHLVAGHPAAELHRLADQVVHTMQPKIWPETRSLLEAHVQAGHEVWLISATPDFLAEELASALGATGGIGSGLEVKDGVFTGTFLGPTMHGQQKAVAASALMADRGYDPADCFAYSDSIHDLPLLTAVGTPVAINPDRGLEQHARGEGWRVLALDPASIRAERKRLRARIR